MKGRSKMGLLWAICLTITLFLVAICSSNQHAFSQGSQPLAFGSAQLESIKIDNIVPSQTVDLEKELMVAGQSSDNATKDCSVSVIVNSIQPYQNAVANGPGGPTDFSQWKFVLDEQYTQLKEGSNKITAKILCQTSPARWYSVVVFGIPNSNVTETVSPQPTEQQPNLSETVSPQPTEQQPNLSGATEEQSNMPEVMPPEPAQQELFVTISPLKNPVARGDRQNATITVMDSSNRPVADAQVKGKLIYPGDNFEKEFNGITDSEGKFVYSWTIGENGDVGALDIEVEVSSQAYPSAAEHSSFEITESGESSNTEDPFNSNSD
ncbi:MAG: hypothetical protein QOK88_10650 [Nitrososphaeraceae archaeon]|nr:hypothetical protein [Nitrososphaeraceae archaeon]MDW0156030.1 hypothetical protein [Nitrososphaeraceae archaeon]